MVIWIPWSDVV